MGLQERGYQVDAVERGDDAIDQLKWYEYDVAILDWRMPGREGIDVVRWARSNNRPTAILMLTARDTSADRIIGLDSGADDYLVKPFDFGELLARVRALQRRPRGVDSPVLRSGRLELDPLKRSVEVQGRPLRHADRIPRARAVDAPLTGGGHAQADRRARVGGRNRPARLECDRRPAEPAARQIARRGRAHSYCARLRLPARGWRMSATPHQQHSDVGRLAVRVAIRATLLVAVLYLIVAGAVAAYSTGSLTEPGRCRPRPHARSLRARRR